MYQKVASTHRTTVANTTLTRRSSAEGLVSHPTEETGKGGGTAAVPAPSWYRAESFAQLLYEKACRSADAVAFRFVLDDGRVEELTYAELDKRASAIAAGILEATSGRAEPALLLYAPGADYVAGLFGCFYAGVPAVPAFPPGTTRLHRTMSRLLSIIGDTDANVVLTTSDIAPPLEEWLASALDRRPPRVLATDMIDSGGEGRSPAIPPDRVAVLQYTSGSTSLPRGVMLTHAQLIANCADISRALGVHDASSAALWLPPYHDMGLIGGILTPLAASVPVTFMSPTTFLRRPLSWLHMVSRYRATITGGPNFAYDLCVRRAKDADLEGLDLSSVELTFTGAEPVRPDTIERFVERFEPCGFRAESFYPCYGLAEATLFVTGGNLVGGWRAVSVARDALELERTARSATPGESARKLVGCGAPGPDTRLLIVDPATNEPLGTGGVGEVWVSSPSVAVGYWQRAAESADTFQARTTTGEGPFLRTGDLGFLRDGELFVAGRTKDVIVLNGRNYHPVDIEQVCEAAVAGIRGNCGAAFAVEDDEGAAAQLVVVYEVDAGMNEEQHRAAIEGIRRTVSIELNLPPHAVVLIAPRTIPKTSSGKVQRWLCRRQYLAGHLNEVARWPSPSRPETAPVSAQRSE
jgi:acyl-CoA synthetase (AMP-forming)/AMP-acid ligase II